MPLDDDDHILEAIAGGDWPIADIARDAGLSILQLARIVAQPQNLQQLRQVAQLVAAQRDIVLSRLKTDAVVRLAELTQGVEAMDADTARATETMRKACVDLLRCPFAVLLDETPSRRAPLRQPSPEDPTPEPVSEERILAALEQLGAMGDDDEAPVPVDIDARTRRDEGNTRDPGAMLRPVGRSIRADDSAIPQPCPDLSEANMAGIGSRVDHPALPSGTTRGATTPVMTPDARSTCGRRQTDNHDLKIEHRKLPDDAHPP